LTAALVKVQMMQYISANLKSYGLTDTEVSDVMAMFTAIDAKLAEIKELANNMTAQGATIDEMVAAITPLITELQELKANLVTTLESYNITIVLPRNPPERPEGPGYPPMHMSDNNTSERNYGSPVGCRY